MGGAKLAVMQGAGVHEHIHMKTMKLASVRIMLPHVSNCSQH